MAETTIKINLEATEKVSQAVQSIKKQFDSIKPSFASLAVAAGAVSVAIGAIGKKALEEAGQLEKLNRQLITATGSSKIAGDMLNWAGKQKLPFEADDIQESITQLAKFTRAVGLSADQNKKWTTLSAQLATGMGKDLASTTEAVSQVLLGSPRALMMLRKEFGITTQNLADYGAKMGEAGAITLKTTDDQNKFREALEKVIQTRFGGAVEREMDTIEGASIGLKNALDNIYDTIGLKLMPVYIDLTKKSTVITEKMLAFTEANTGLVAGLGGVTAGLATIITGMAGVGAVLPSLSKGFKAFSMLFSTWIPLGIGIATTALRNFIFSPVGILTLAIGSLVNAFLNLKGATDKALTGISDKYVKQLEEVGKKHKITAKDIEECNRQMIAEINIANTNMSALERWGRWILGWGKSVGESFKLLGKLGAQYVEEAFKGWIALADDFSTRFWKRVFGDKNAFKGFWENFDDLQKKSKAKTDIIVTDFINSLGKGYESWGKIKPTLFKLEDFLPAPSPEAKPTIGGVGVSDGDEDAKKALQDRLTLAESNYALQKITTAELIKQYEIARDQSKEDIDKNTYQLKINELIKKEKEEGIRILELKRELGIDEKLTTEELKKQLTEYAELLNTDRDRLEAQKRIRDLTEEEKKKLIEIEEKKANILRMERELGDGTTTTFDALVAQLRKLSEIVDSEEERLRIQKELATILGQPTTTGAMPPGGVPAPTISGEEYGPKPKEKVSFLQNIKGALEDTETPFANFVASLNNMKNDVSQIFVNLGETMQATFRTAIVGMLTGAENWTNSIKQLWKGLRDMVISAIADMIAKWLTFMALKAIGKAFGIDIPISYQTSPGEYKIVPGAPNQPVPIIAHGGEIVGRPVPASKGGGELQQGGKQALVINQHFHGITTGSEVKDAVLSVMREYNLLASRGLG